MPPWVVVDVKPELAAFYSARLAEALRNERFKVVTSAEIATLLSIERQKQLLGCADEGSACLTELANALGADATVSVQLARLEDVYSVQVKLLSSGDGHVLAETRAQGSDQNSLLEQLDLAAARLAAAVRPPPPSRSARWVLAGVTLLSGAASAALLIGARVQYGALASSLHRPSDADSPAALSLASSGNALQTSGWLALGVACAALAATVIFFVLGHSP